MKSSMSFGLWPSQHQIARRNSIFKIFLIYKVDNKLDFLCSNSFVNVETKEIIFYPNPKIRFEVKNLRDLYYGTEGASATREIVHLLQGEG